MNAALRHLLPSDAELLHQLIKGRATDIKFGSSVGNVAFVFEESFLDHVALDGLASFPKARQGRDRRALIVQVLRFHILAFGHRHTRSVENQSRWRTHLVTIRAPVQD